MRRKCVVVGVLVVFLITTIPFVQAETDHFSNSIVLVIGKCNTVSTNALWLFGGKLLIHKMVTIQTNSEEGEKINALVLPPNFGLYFGHESLLLQMEGATGYIFWGEHSFLLQKSSQRIVAVCKAGDLWITY